MSAPATRPDPLPDPEPSLVSAASGPPRSPVNGAGPRLEPQARQVRPDKFTDDKKGRRCSCIEQPCLHRVERRRRDVRRLALAYMRTGSFGLRASANRVLILLARRAERRARP
jgi:hypothetical protein